MYPVIRCFDIGRTDQQFDAVLESLSKRQMIGQARLFSFFDNILLIKKGLDIADGEYQRENQINAKTVLLRTTYCTGRGYASPYLRQKHRSCDLLATHFWESIHPSPAHRRNSHKRIASLLRFVTYFPCILSQLWDIATRNDPAQDIFKGVLELFGEKVSLFQSNTCLSLTCLSSVKVIQYCCRMYNAFPRLSKFLLNYGYREIWCAISFLREWFVATLDDGAPHQMSRRTDMLLAVYWPRIVSGISLSVPIILDRKRSATTVFREIAVAIRHVKQK